MTHARRMRTRLCGTPHARHPMAHIHHGNCGRDTSYALAQALVPIQSQPGHKICTRQQLRAVSAPFVLHTLCHSEATILAMRIAVTGAGGFLGFHVVHALLAAGHDVRALIHQRALTCACEQVRIQDIAALSAQHFAGCDALIHAAAFHGKDSVDAARMEHVNVAGTRAVLAAAIAAGVQRIVHVSTMGTCTPRADRGEACETDFVAITPRTTIYVRTKLAAEQMALAAEGAQVVVVNPSALVGAGDTTPSVTGRRIIEVLQGKRPRVHEGPVNHAPVSDVAAGILLALQCGVPRQRYLLGGANLDEAAFLALVCDAAKLPVPAAPKGSIIERLLRRRNPIPGNLRIQDAKAQSELGYAKSPLAAAFSAAVVDFRARCVAP